ncbi:hypothetical protein FNF28_00624 [Cafeteria roenbergensis]|nr:hypothetical protein FNF28_00624 [Cafeteria roenbergensis]
MAAGLRRAGALALRAAPSRLATTAPAAARWASSSSDAPAGSEGNASMEQMAEAAVSAGDWRAFSGGKRVGDAMGEADTLGVRLMMNPADAVGMGERLALPASFAEHTWAPDEDPLHRLGLGFNPSEVRYEGRVAVTRAQREDCRYRMGRLVAPIDSLELPPVAEKWLREILGPRLDWQSGVVQITVRRHASAAENRREAFEQLSAACRRARELEEELGDFVQRSPIVKDWGVGQRRARRARKSNPTRPPFTIHPVARPARPDQGPPVDQLLRMRHARMSGRPFGEDVALSVTATSTASKMLETGAESIADEPVRTKRNKHRGGKRRK